MSADKTSNIKVELLEALTASQAASSALTRLAQAQVEDGQLQEAVASLNRALAVNPEDLAARAMIAQCLEELGQAEQALNHLLAAAQSLAGQSETFQSLARLLVEQGRAKDADWATAVAEALAKPPTLGPQADPDQDTLTMAEIYANQGMIDEAVAIYRKLLSARPGDAELAQRLADLRRQQGEEQPEREILMGRLEALRKAAVNRGES